MRLTRKINHYCDTDIDNDYGFADEDVDTAQIVDKLGRLEDLEDELGCPLEVLFKALSDRVYNVERKEYVNVSHIQYSFIDHKYEIYATNRNWCGWLAVESYKKTWWLREDKSE